MRILFCAMKYDYGDPKRGVDLAYHNCYLTFKQLGHQVIPFDFFQTHQKFGRDKMNDLLWKTVKETKPDFLFCSLFQEQLKKEVVAQISKTGTVTFCWFVDDAWRFENFGRFWAPVFNWVGTTEEDYVQKYNNIGVKNAVFFPYAVNPNIFRPYNLSKIHNVTFIGGPHGFRQDYIRKLRESGVPVVCFGDAWENGRLSGKNFVKIISQTKINLNFTETSYQGGTILQFFRKLEIIPRIRQHKARIFEITACAGFELTGWTKGIENLYQPGKEIEVFHNIAELKEKTTSYLRNEKKREKIAKAGFQRTLADHTYQKRFANLFATMGIGKS